MLDGMSIFLCFCFRLCLGFWLVLSPESGRSRAQQQQRRRRSLCLVLSVIPHTIYTEVYVVQLCGMPDGQNLFVLLLICSQHAIRPINNHDMVTFIEQNLAFKNASCIALFLEICDYLQRVVSKRDCT